MPHRIVPFLDVNHTWTFMADFCQCEFWDETIRSFPFWNIRRPFSTERSMWDIYLCIWKGWRDNLEMSNPASKIISSFSLLMKENRKSRGFPVTYFFLDTIFFLSKSVSENASIISLCTIGKGDMSCSKNL